jgi:hypothetical protein
MAVSTGVMMALNTGVSMMGQLQEGRARKAAGDMQAQQDRARAGQEEDAANQEADRIRRAGRRTQGAARAAFAGSGIDVNSGSAMTVDEEIGRDSEKDAFNTLLTGKRRAGAYRFNADQAAAAGRNAKTASVLGAAATGMQGWKGVKQAQPESEYRYKVPDYPGAEY